MTLLPRRSEPRATLELDQAMPYRELRDPPLPDHLRGQILACFAAQRAAIVAPPRVDEAGARESERQVSVEQLAAIRSSGRRVAGIASEREIATAIPFNVRNVRDTVQSAAVAAERRRLDRALGGWIAGLFDGPRRPVLFPAGHWWYPPGTHLGWHTNERFPGWRIYLSHSEEPGASFFRYRDPRDGTIVTSPDGAWDLRLFEVSRERLLWHAVATRTHRFSIGWIVKPWTLRDAASLRVKRALEALGV